MKIYTKTGDKGKTSLFTGQRVSKADLRVEAYGTIDELNSTIGVAIAQIQNFPRSGISLRETKLKNELIKIQKDLLEIGSVLASPLTKRYTLNARRLKNKVKDFEKMIDEMTGKLPSLQNFILPGGGGAGSTLHFARTVCRRTERRVVALAEKEKVSSEIIVYFNRLSDLLFTMARFINFKEKSRGAGSASGGKKEIVWPS